MLSLLHRIEITENVKERKRERSCEVYGLSSLSSLSQSVAVVCITSKLSSVCNEDAIVESGHVVGVCLVE